MLHLARSAIKTGAEPPIYLGGRRLQGTAPWLPEEISGQTRSRSLLSWLRHRVAQGAHELGGLAPPNFSPSFLKVFLNRHGRSNRAQWPHGGSTESARGTGTGQRAVPIQERPAPVSHGRRGGRATWGGQVLRVPADEPGSRGSDPLLPLRRTSQVSPARGRGLGGPAPEIGRAATDRPSCGGIGRG